MRTITLLFVSLIFFTFFSTTARAQIKSDAKTAMPKTLKSDTTQNLHLKLLLSPSFQGLTPTSDNYNRNFSNKSKALRFSKTAKIFLGLGADLIRGGSENVPMYSFENAWKYPGPTVEYPETATEYELFLERYQLYIPEN